MTKYKDGVCSRRLSGVISLRRKLAIHVQIIISKLLIEWYSCSAGPSHSERRESRAFEMGKCTSINVSIATLRSTHLVSHLKTWRESIRVDGMIWGWLHKKERGYSYQRKKTLVRLAESLKKRTVDLTVPIIFRMKDEMQESTSARFDEWELQCMYSASGQIRLMIAWQPLWTPDIELAPSYAWPIQLLGRSSNRFMQPKVWSVIAWPVVQSVGKNARKSSRISCYSQSR